MKKLAAILISFVIILAMAACSDEKIESGNTDNISHCQSALIPENSKVLLHTDSTSPIVTEYTGKYITGKTTKDWFSRVDIKKISENLYDVYILGKQGDVRAMSFS